MAPRVCDKCGEWVSPHRVLDHRCKPELLRIMDGCDLRIKGEIDGVVWEICQKYHPEKLVPEVWYKDGGIYDAIETLVERIKE